MTKITTSGSEPGLSAVRSKYGDDVVQQILNWPAVARNYFTALFEVAEGQLDSQGDDFGAERVAEEVRLAEKRVARAKRDIDWALDQAKSIITGELLWPLATVPPLRWFRGFFGHPERDALHAEHVAAGRTLAVAIDDMRALTDAAAKDPHLELTSEELEREGGERPPRPVIEPIAIDEAEVARRREQARRLADEAAKAVAR